MFGALLLMLVVYIGSFLFTAAGSGTILDVNKYPSYATPQKSELAESPNAVTAGAATLSDSVDAGFVKFGRSVYGASKAFQDTTVRTSKSIYTATIHGASATGYAIHGGVTNVIGWHVGVATSVARTPFIHNFLTPSKTVAVQAINTQTSIEMLEQYNQDQKLQLKKLLDAQISANAELGGRVVAGDANRGGYPAQWDNSRQDSMIDYWGMFNRECVSYAAWKVHQTYGNMPNWGGIGNANQWTTNAKNAGIPTGSTPKINSVAISMEGYYGHAMWVDAIEGNMIHVSQYNYDLNGRYSEMWLDGTNLSYIYFGEAQ